MKTLYILLLLFISTNLFACNNNQTQHIEKPAIMNLQDTIKIKIKIGNSTFTATLYDNAAAIAFKSLLPMTANMVELNEKVYGSSTVVLFYKTFSTSYNYTRLGKIDDVSGLAAAVGSGSVAVTFELEL